MDSYLPSNEVINYEDTLYVNPETSLGEQNKFIENLRGLQQQQNAEIATDTTNLGTYPASQSNLGGLGGGESYFTARYQTPQTNALVNDLRATANAQALTDVLKLNQSIMQQKLQTAQENARKRAAARAARARAQAAAAATSGSVEGKVNVNAENKPSKNYGIPGATMKDKGDYFEYKDPKTGEKAKVMKSWLNKIYDKKTGRLTNDGKLILEIQDRLNLGR